MYQHIEFIDGNNPYICKTEREFKRMNEKYLLIPEGENCWKATDRILYLIVGFADKNKMATYNKIYKTKGGAMNAIRKLIKGNKFSCINLRKEIEYLKNNEDLHISTSTLVRSWIILN